MMLCCGTRSLADKRTQEKSQAAREAEARHARTISILSPPPRAYVVDRPLSYDEHMEAPPPYSAAVQYSSPPAMTYDEKNEKQRLAASGIPDASVNSRYRVLKLCAQLRTS